MSRTINHMPAWVQMYERAGRKCPKNWRNSHRWGDGPKRYDFDSYDDYFLAREEWDNSHPDWESPYGGFKRGTSQFRRELNRDYRAKCKQKMREGDYELPKPVHNMLWLYW